MKSEDRDLWVDKVKALACVLVVMGHFFQSMTKAGILQANFWYFCFDKTIYYFHVPLFFICSGYLYQKYSIVDCIGKWANNVLKKAISLGIPYFAFSTVTWILKKVFSNSVNTEIGGLGEILFLKPTAPYWYLYVLFFIFCISITIKSKRIMILYFVISAFAKLLSFIGIETGIYLVDQLMANDIWFILGVGCAYYSVDTRVSELGVKPFTWVIEGVSAFSYIIVAILLARANINFCAQSFFMGIWACINIISIFMLLKKRQSRLTIFFTKYTMAIFLMHTIFAAPIRSILLKANIRNSLIHVVIGLFFSFVGPIVAAYVMSKIGVLDVLIYPTRYIKVKREKEGK